MLENLDIEKINSDREYVISTYDTAIKKNKNNYLKKNIKATSEYIYDNQKEDASFITNIFYTSPIRAISILKKTKVGMDGLMIQIAINMSTHLDDNFILDYNNIFFITAMSNKLWETDMKEKIPECFKKNVYHHGKLLKLQNKIKEIKNTLIIIDEIDSGDKQFQRLHKILKNSNIYDIEYMKKYNIRFIFVSATMKYELLDLTKWGDYHCLYKMTIPESYIGHKDFLERNIIQEFYPIDNQENAEKWIQEDILDNYKNDYRIHIIRTVDSIENFIKNACIKKGILFKNHNSVEKIQFEELNKIFENITNHIVITVKEFYRRANLIPNEWKIKIGATHEKFVKNINENVQVQGLSGRMTGYWKDIINKGHKTGPHRTSIQAIIDYEEFYNNPYKESKNNKKLITDPKYINIEYKEVDIIENKRIPICISNLDPTCILFKKGSNIKEEKIKYINNLIQNNKEYQNLYHYINHPDVICEQITQPKNEKSYKKHIIDTKNAFYKNKQFSIDVKDKSKNSWQVFIDNKENCLYILIWCIDYTLYNKK
jgi:hypothetical protein